MAAAIVIGAQGAHRAAKTLDAPAPQILREMEEGAGQEWHQYWLVHRVRPGVWITIGPDGEVGWDDLAGVDVVPLPRKGSFPIADRPFRGHGAHTPAQLAELRGRARAMALLHDVPGLAGVPPTADAMWMYADPSHPKFSEEVDASLLAGGERVRVEDSVGLVKFTDDRWTFMELVVKKDRDAWLAEKSGGTVLRDKRLTGPVVSATEPWPLFRVVARKFDTASKMDARIFGDSPCAVSEVTESITTSNHEPNAFCSEMLRGSGVGLKSGIGQELQVHFFSLWLLAVVDAIDLRRSATAQHLARRILQQTRALKRNPKAPDYDGLDTYLRHMQGAGGEIRAVKFEAHVAAENRDTAQIMKQNRLQKEEQEAEEKRRRGKNDPNKKNKGKDEE